MLISEFLKQVLNRLDVALGGGEPV